MGFRTRLNTTVFCIKVHSVGHYVPIALLVAYGVGRQAVFPDRHAFQNLRHFHRVVRQTVQVRPIRPCPFLRKILHLVFIRGSLITHRLDTRSAYGGPSIGRAVRKRIVCNDIGEVHGMLRCSIRTLPIHNSLFKASCRSLDLFCRSFRIIVDIGIFPVTSKTNFICLVQLSQQLLLGLESLISFHRHEFPFIPGILLSGHTLVNQRIHLGLAFAYRNV